MVEPVSLSTQGKSQDNSVGVDFFFLKGGCIGTYTPPDNKEQESKRRASKKHREGNNGTPPQYEEVDPNSLSSRTACMPSY